MKRYCYVLFVKSLTLKHLMTTLYQDCVGVVWSDLTDIDQVSDFD